MTTAFITLATVVSFVLIVMAFATRHRRTFHLPRAPFDSDAPVAAHVDSDMVLHDRMHQASAAR